MTTAPTPRLGRARRAIAFAGGALGTVVVFAGAVVTGALLHLDLPVTRRVVAAQVTKALDGFRGSLTLERVRGLSLRGLGEADVTVRDPEGRIVILARGVHADVDALTLLRAVLLGKGDIPLDVRHGRVGYVEVALWKEPDGSLSLTHAFEPKKPAPSAPGPSRSLALSIPEAELPHVWVHGDIGLPFIDADADGLVASVNSRADGLAIDVHRLALAARAMPNGANPSGALTGHLGVPSGAGKLEARATFDGRVADVPLRVRGEMNGDDVAAVVDLPRVEAAKLRALADGAPIYQPLEAHVEAKGTLPEVHAQATLGVGTGTVRLDGKVALAAALRADVQLVVEAVEPRAFAPAAPEGNVSLTLGAHADRTASGALGGSYELSTSATRLGGQVVPATAVKGAFTEQSVRGKAAIAERGAPTQLDFDLHPDGHGDRVVDFDVRSSVPSLTGVARLGPIAAGSAQLHAAGKVSLGRSAIDARVEAELSRLAKGSIKLERGYVTAHLHGPFERLVVDGAIRGKALDAGGYFFATLKATVSGPVASPFVTTTLERGRDDVPNVSAKASLATGGGVTVRGAEVTVARDDVTLVTRVAVLRAQGGVLTVDGVTIEGAGAPIEGSARLATGALSVKARAEDVDMMRIARLFSLGNRLAEGHARFDVDLAYAKKSASGRATIGVRGAKLGVIESADATLVATVSGREVTTVLDASLAKAGKAHLETKDLVLGGDIGDLSAWRAATGNLLLDATLDLEKLQAAVPDGTVPLERIAGTVTVHASVAKRTASDLPDLALALQTQGLDVTGAAATPATSSEKVTHPTETAAVAAPPPMVLVKAEADSAAPAANKGAAPVAPITKNAPATDTQVVEKAQNQPWHSEGLDLSVELRVDGKGHIGLGGKLFEKDGTFAELHATADPDFERLEDASAPTRALLLALTPVEVHLVVPRRDVDNLPAVIKPAGVKGAVGLDLEAHGSVARPRVSLTASAYQLAADARVPLPLDATVTARYDGSQADIDVRASREEGVLLDGNATVDVRALDLLHPPAGTPLPWAASSDLRLTAFPLHSLGAFSGQAIEGCVSGVISLRDLHRDATLSAHLEAVRVRLGEAEIPHAKVDAELGGGAVKAEARLEQSDGYLDVKAAAAMRWGTDVAPTLEKTEPIALDLDAKQFRLAALLPFVQGTFAQLDGRMDADVHLKTGKSAGDTHASGTIAARSVRMEIPAMGQELKNGVARLTVEPNGAVRIDELRIDGTSGRVAVTGSAQLEGMALRRADAQIRIARDQKLPLTLQGVSLGEAWGAIDVTATQAAGDRAMNIDVRIPQLHADLPDTATHAAQELEDEPTIKIGVNRKIAAESGRDRFTLLPLRKPEDAPKTGSEAAAAPSYHVTFHLGQDVRVKKGTQVEIYVAGNPTLELGEKARMTGGLALSQGRLEVFGKRFRIEHGTVAFTGDDPSNPEVIVTASMDAVDGTKVYVDFVGPVKTGKVKLRSEPPHTENEIVALILFGSTDGGVGAASPGQESGAAKAAGVGGGVATQGVNKALSNLTEIDVQTRVDTSDSQNPRPELAVQISRKVTAEIAYNLGLPAPGQNPDKTLLILDYRFRRNWSMLTTFGDHGSSIVDFVWQYRY